MKHIIISFYILSIFGMTHITHAAQAKTQTQIPQVTVENCKKVTFGTGRKSHLDKAIKKELERKRRERMNAAHNQPSLKKAKR